MRDNASTLPSSDSDVNNMTSSAQVLKKMEKINKTQIRHTLYGETVTILQQGFQKISKAIEKPDYVKFLKT